MFGVKEVYLSNNPSMGVPIFIAIYVARKALVVKCDQLVVGDLCKVTLSVDHSSIILLIYKL